MQWIKDCPVPADEEFKRVAELWEVEMMKDVITPQHLYPYCWSLEDAVFTKDKGKVFSLFCMWRWLYYGLQNSWLRCYWL